MMNNNNDDEGRTFDDRSVASEIISLVFFVIVIIVVVAALYAPVRDQILLWRAGCVESSIGTCVYPEHLRGYNPHRDGERLP